MKKRFVWFYLTLIFACHYALDQRTESPYETIINIEERYPDFHIFEPPRVLDATDSTHMSEEDLFAYEEWFTTPPNFAEMETTANNPTDGNSEEDTSAYIPEEHMYTGEFAPRLKITYTPYSALLYQEDEFGLELLCPGYWLQRHVLLIRLESPHGEDYALLCDHSLVGMLTADRTKYERVFGKLTLVDLTVAEPWINRILEILEDEDEQRQQLLSDSRFL
uniref:Peptidase S1 domain-containing protein n=1 Tax=Anopheles melas TaxID=34690 RepID=A0A182UD48_9DIPT